MSLSPARWPPAANWHNRLEFASPSQPLNLFHSSPFQHPPACRRARTQPFQHAPKVWTRDELGGSLGGGGGGGSSSRKQLACARPTTSGLGSGGGGTRLLNRLLQTVLVTQLYLETNPEARLYPPPTGGAKLPSGRVAWQERREKSGKEEKRREKERKEKLIGANLEATRQARN